MTTTPLLPTGAARPAVPCLTDEQERMVREYLPLAASLAMRYRGRSIAYDDLYQVACLGLVNAVRGFDPSRGVDFRGYAVPTIRGELRRHFRDAGWTIRPPRRIQELQPRLWEAEATLVQQLHRSPRPAEIADFLGVPEDDVVEALCVDGCFSPSSLDAPVTADRDSSIGDQEGGEDLAFDQSEATIMLAPAVRRLQARDRRIVQLRFFEGWTQQQIGEEIGVTQMQVSRLLNRILGDLRDTIGTPA